MVLSCPFFDQGQQRVVNGVRMTLLQMPAHQSDESWPDWNARSMLMLCRRIKLHALGFQLKPMSVPLTAYAANPTP
jgi:hypothetical protein